MKNLIILLLLAFFTSLTSNSFAQTFGLKVGANFANMLYKNDYYTYSTNFKPNLGLVGGIVVDLPVKDWLSIETGLQISKKGYRFNYFNDDTDSEHKGRASLYYLELPLLVKPSYDLDNFKIYGIVGPYFALGAVGKGVDHVITYQGEELKNDLEVEWGNGTNIEQYDLIFKRGEIGLTFGGGVMVKKTQFGISYSTGSNITVIQDYGTVQKNRVVSLTFEYMFGD